MSTKKSSPHALSETMELRSLPAIEPPSPPQFPTFQQLVEAATESQPATGSSRKLNDLFDGMLGTLDPLLADYRETPEKYGEETHALLEQLTHGMTSLERLSTTERMLLNRATFDYYQSVPPKIEAPKPQPTESESELEKLAEYEEEVEVTDDAPSETKGPGPVPGVDVPVTELPAYWWLN